MLKAFESQLMGTVAEVLFAADTKTGCSTPRKYLRWNRMNHLHRNLLAAQSARSKVTELAIRWGFHELGRTAVEYKQLFAITLIRISLGMSILARWPTTAKKRESTLRLLSIVFLLLIIALIVLKNADNLGGFFAQSGLATLTLNLAALALGYLLTKWSRLPHTQSVSISFEVGIQNGTLALFVAGTLIGNEVMMIPAVTYSLTMLLSGAAFGWWVTNRVS